MSQLRVAPIVEGHGEYEAVRTLLTRIWGEIVGGEFIDVIRPIRIPRTRMLKEDQLARAVQLATSKLRIATPPLPSAILVLLDANGGLPCVLGPQLLGVARGAQPNQATACVVARVEYETWFVGAAESLDQFLNLADATIPDNPEDEGCGKGWIQNHFRGAKYSETVDQPRMTAKMNLARCRERCPSFDKLCREVERCFRRPE